MTVVTNRLKIGLSACFSHADPGRSLFTGKTLQYVEQSIAHWLMSTGAMGDWMTGSALIEAAPQSSKAQPTGRRTASAMAAAQAVNRLFAPAC